MRSYYCAQCRTIVSVDDTEAASVTCVSCGQLCTCTESEGDADQKANADFTADVAAISIADIPSLAIDLDVVNLPLSPDYAVEVEVTARHVSRILINGREIPTLVKLDADGKPLDFRCNGGMGVWNAGGTTTFTRASLD